MMDELNVTATPGFLKSPPLRSPLVDIDTNVSKDDTPTWLKTASAVCDLDKVLDLAEADAAADVSVDAAPASSSSAVVSSAPPASNKNNNAPMVVIILCGENKLGAIKQKKADAASLRKDMQRELAKPLKRSFPKGWLFSLPGDEDVPILRTQESTWLVEELATHVDGRLHLSLIADPTPSKLAVVTPAVAMRAFTRQALGMMNHVKQWQHRVKYAPVNSFLQHERKKLATKAAAPRRPQLTNADVWWGVKPTVESAHHLLSGSPYSRAVRLASITSTR